ncbi:MAG TPA: hypothetical protein VF234_04030, partial [Limnochordia bacterium]
MWRTTAVSDWVPAITLAALALSALLWAARPVGAVWAAPAPPGDVRLEDVRLENEHLRVVVDGRSGQFLSIYHKGAGLELIAHPPGPHDSPPWTLLFEQRDVSLTAFDRFTARRLDAAGHRWEWRWEVTPAVAVVVRAELLPGARDLVLWPRVENTSERAVSGLAYPVLEGIGPLSLGGLDDELIHPFATGFLFRNPTVLFSIRPYGIPHGPYPSGEGASMQFMAYYRRGVGGFYFAAHDPHKTAKELNATRSARGDGLTFSFVHRNWDLQPQRGLDLGYPVLIGVLAEGRWEAAAERYRRWALAQPWARRGPLRDRVVLATGQGADRSPATSAPDAAPWLISGVGVATFGTKGAVPEPERYEEIHRIVGVPALHVYYGRPIPDGTGLDPTNAAQIRRQGDHIASFENDIVVPVYAPDYDAGAAIVPRKDAAWGDWRATWMDPTLPYIRE